MKQAPLDNFERQVVKTVEAQLGCITAWEHVISLQQSACPFLYWLLIRIKHQCAFGLNAKTRELTGIGAELEP